MPLRRDLGLLLLNSHLQVAWANEQMVEYLGLYRVEALQGNVQALLDGPVTQALARPERFVCTLLESYSDRTHESGLTCHILPAEGRPERWLEYTSRPIYSGKYAGGRLECYLDITEQYRTEASSTPGAAEAVPSISV